ncbi:hypothetical protein QEH52_02510 [Coraliomargarita sp. SDUM461003]|uniref:Oligogalacturonate lyase domain-containing protein n=1 Tax=Thalassobacterium maritimum TaxID=3041265 RepID=A0ABU1ASZ2_9BACT|nr:hypothetical protein [Coraliomargarita sp. SDUM461003]MDQ8206364.1 hypothetical protein [Coraliomargarita sp. SDUM461003]
MSELSSKPAKAITSSSKHHFFGYYDKSCWDASQRWVLGQESMFMDRAPNAGDTITIGVIDTHNKNAWRPLTQTSAWNWQQGCMLQWLGDGTEIIFNDIGPDGFYARIINIETEAERKLSRPIYAVNRQGTHAVSLNFSRLQNQRPGYGYAGIPDKWEAVATPTDDGLYSLDLQTGASELILSLADAANFQRMPEFEGKLHRFNHIQFSTNEQRFAFLHRYKTPDEEVGRTRLMTMNLDGSELRCLSDHGFVSHYDWQADKAVLAWSGRHGIGDRYFLFEDKIGGDIQIIGGERFKTDGHCSFSPDGQYMLTDSYPDETDHRSLLLYHIERDELTTLGRFYSPPMEWQIRCDLHPRWNRDGTQVCIDSIHEGHRQMYVLSI